MKTTRDQVILAFALFALLFAVGLEHPYLVPSGVDFESVILNKKSIISVLKEISFALFIAWLIIVSIERESRESDQKRAASLRQEIASDVFRGVFSRNLPSEYIDTVIAAALQPTLVREYIAIHYRLDQSGLPEDDELILTFRLAFRFKNVTDRIVEEDVPLSIPINSNGDNKVLSFQVGRDLKNLEDILPTLSTVESGQHIKYDWRVSLEPNDVLECVIETQIKKQASDVEIFSTNFPALKVELSLDVRVEGVEAFVHERTASPLDLVHATPNNSSARWIVNGPILPNDSITLWWKRNPNSPA